MSEPINIIPELERTIRALGYDPRTASILVRVEEPANPHSYVQVPISQVIGTPGGALTLVVKVASGNNCAGCCLSDKIRSELIRARELSSALGLGAL